MSPFILHVASSNPGKLRDFAASADHFGVAIARVPGLDRIPPPPEEEPTFEGNARAKAVYYSGLAPGLYVLADDSGLEVDALNGSPGVRSARFAADAGFRPTGDLDQDNNLLLLHRMRNAGDRDARYRCALALARDGKVVLTSEGSVEGTIAEEPRGAGGFGYDPLFFLPRRGKTMAEIDPSAKAELSHRGHAFLALLNKLSGLTPSS